MCPIGTYCLCSRGGVRQETLKHEKHAPMGLLLMFKVMGGAGETQT